MAAGLKRSACLSSSSDSGGPTTKKTKKRQFIKSTFDKWQREHEQEHQMLTWLRCNLEADKVHVATLYCAIYRKYEQGISTLKNFSNSWIVGSTNLRLSNMLDHAGSDTHKAAMTRMKADSARERGESAVLDTPIGRCLFTLDETTHHRLKVKFDICYGKAELTLFKVSSLVRA